MRPKRTPAGAPLGSHVVRAPDATAHPELSGVGRAVGPSDGAGVVSDGLEAPSFVPSVASGIIGTVEGPLVDGSLASAPASGADLQSAPFAKPPAGDCESRVAVLAP